ncbi:Mog1p/PsbP-like protein [Nemania serpens]|nr:Mog1p/PsbP-like protein [Nemania serpens]
MTTYQSTPLFGGALVCDLPTNFADVSQLRQVPNHQEVYIDKDGFTSIIIEINERVGDEGSSTEIDGRALTEHLEGIIGEDVDRLKVWNTTPTQFSKLEYVICCLEDIPAYTLIATLSPQAPPPPTEAESSSAPRPSAPDFTAIILTLVRLEQEQTDILITVNVPHINGEYDEDDVDLELGKQGKLIGDAVDYASRIWESFTVKDWGLFKEV